MRKRLGYIALLLFGGASIGSSWADPGSSSTYAHAKQAYAANDWAKAQKLLAQYQQEDRGFLLAHRFIADQIQAVLMYCENRVATWKLAAVATGIDADDSASENSEAKPPPPPKLP